MFVSSLPLYSDTEQFQNNSQDDRNHRCSCCLCVQCPSLSWSPVTTPVSKLNEVITVLSNVSRNRNFKSYVTLYVHLAWRHSMSVTDKEYKLRVKHNIHMCLVTHPTIYIRFHHPPSDRTSSLVHLHIAEVWCSILGQEA
jgi:hypothetical protein